MRSVYKFLGIKHGYCISKGLKAALLEGQLRCFPVPRMRPVEHLYKMVVAVGQLHDRNDGCNMLPQLWMPYVFG